MGLLEVGNQQKSKLWLIVLAIGLLFIASCHPVHADEPDPLRVVTIGAVVFAAPAFYETNDLQMGHAWELSGFTYATTDGLGRFLPKDMWFISPIINFIFLGGYRLSELGHGQDDLIFKKMIIYQGKQDIFFYRDNLQHTRVVHVSYSKNMSQYFHEKCNHHQDS
jgi:hypothetical protein